MIVPYVLLEVGGNLDSLFNHVLDLLMIVLLDHLLFNIISHIYWIVHNPSITSIDLEWIQLNIMCQMYLV